MTVSDPPSTTTHTQTRNRPTNSLITAMLLRNGKPTQKRVYQRETIPLQVSRSSLNVCQPFMIGLVHQIIERGYIWVAYEGLWLNKYHIRQNHSAIDIL